MYRAYIDSPGRTSPGSCTQPFGANRRGCYAESDGSCTAYSAGPRPGRRQFTRACPRPSGHPGADARAYTARAPP